MWICILLLHPWKRGICLILLHFDHFTSFPFIRHFIIYDFTSCCITISCTVCLALHLPALALVKTECYYATECYHYWYTAYNYSSSDGCQCSGSSTRLLRSTSTCVSRRQTALLKLVRLLYMILWLLVRNEDKPITQNLLLTKYGQKQCEFSEKRLLCGHECMCHGKNRRLF